MKIKQLLDEDFVNYKKPSMFIGTCVCDWKCCHDGGFPETVCQNNALAKSKVIDCPDDALIKRFIANDITEAIVFGGLEPFKQYDELYGFIKKLRVDYGCHDDVVIYTGYYEQEVADQIKELSAFDNIIVKFGRYVPNRPKVFDETLGIWLVSDNQKARKIS
jgi:hypothetical protein